MTERDHSNRIVNKLLALLESGRRIDEIHTDQKINEKRRWVTFLMADGKDEKVAIDVEDHAEFTSRWQEVVRLWKSIPNIKLGETKEG